MNPVLKTAVILTLLSQTSCGTIRTISAIREAREKADKTAMCDTRKFLASSILYSGTYDNLVNRILNPFTCHGETCSSLWTYPFKLVGGLIDLGPAIAADTLMLAYTIPVSLTLECDKPETGPADGRSQEIPVPPAGPREVPQAGKPTDEIPRSDPRSD